MRGMLSALGGCVRVYVRVRSVRIRIWNDPKQNTHGRRVSRRALTIWHRSKWNEPTQNIHNTDTLTHTLTRGVAADSTDGGWHHDEIVVCVSL